MSIPAYMLFFLYWCYNRGWRWNKNLVLELLLDHVQRINDPAPQVLAVVTKRRHSRTVHRAHTNNLWASDHPRGSNCRSHLRISLWDLVKDVIMQPGIKDSQIWLSKILRFGCYLQMVNLFGLTLEFGELELHENVKSSYGW